MKKLLTILVAGCISFPALCQTSVIGDSKPIRDTKTGNLSGRTFKITFGAQTVSQNTQSTNDRWKENANDAAIKNDMNSDNTIDHGVKENTAGSMNDQKNNEGMNKENMNSGTMNNQTNANVQGDYSAYSQDMKGKTAEITFTDNEMQSTMLSDNNYKSCPYTVSASSANMLTFYSNCRNEARVKSQFAGVVEGNAISGNMTYTTPDGKMIKYDFKGTAMKKKKMAEGTSGIHE